VPSISDLARSSACKGRPPRAPCAQLQGLHIPQFAPLIQRIADRMPGLAPGMKALILW
jgi:hypothetical protein